MNGGGRVFRTDRLRLVSDEEDARTGKYFGGGERNGCAAFDQNAPLGARHGRRGARQNRFRGGGGYLAGMLRNEGRPDHADEIDAVDRAGAIDRLKAKYDK